MQVFIRERSENDWELTVGDSETKRAISEILRSEGFEVESIPEKKDKKTPDLLARSDTENFLIEIKTKGDDLGELSVIKAELEKGRKVVHSKSGGPNNTLAGILRDGTRQLSTFSNKDAFNLLWVHLEGAESLLQFDQTINTLYGITDIVSSANSQTREKRICFYFYDSTFFRFPTLDGTVVSVRRNLSSVDIQLCINTYSPNKESFRKSKLVEVFKDGVLDPEVLESAGKAYIADCDIDRKNTQEVLNYLGKSIREIKW